MILTTIRSIRIFSFKCILLLWIFLFSNVLPAQTTITSLEPKGAVGIPHIRNYTPEEYHASNQNWSIVQDHRGIMYFANVNGILEYDGTTWRLMPSEIIRSLAITDDGRIYFGSFNDLGYLAPDSIQQLQFVSLLPKISKEYHDFKDVWETLVSPTGIYFRTANFIFHWDGNKMSVVKAQTNFSTLFSVDDRVFVRQPKHGMKEIISDSLVSIPFGDQFGGERTAFMGPMDSGNKKQLLIATRTNGLMLYDDQSLTPFPSESDVIIKEGQVYSGSRLPHQQYALGTIKNGLVIMDASGRMLHHFDKSTGLQDETIWYIYPDNQGGLWTATNTGISRIEIGSPITQFSEGEGLEGSVVDIVRFDGNLYAATTLGLYYLDEHQHAVNGDAKFTRVEGVSPQCWTLLPFGKVLLAGTYDGLYEIKGGKGKIIDSAFGAAFHRSAQDSNRVIVGTSTGMISMYLNNGKWQNEGQFDGIKDEISVIYESPENHYWITTRNSGLFYMDLSKGFTLQPGIIHFDDHGLPPSPNDKATAFESSKGLRFATMQGIYFFDEEKQKFFPDTTLLKGLPKDSSDLYTVSKDNHGNLWMSAGGGSGVAWLQKDGTYQWDVSPFMRNTGVSDYYAYPDPVYDGIIWLCCEDRLIRYDAALASDHPRTYNTYIREVIVNGDSVLYGGAGEAYSSILDLTYNYKSLRFIFGAPSYDADSRTKFQYMLEGYDTDWSSWSSESYKDYTGLSKGTYRFLVRAKNIYRQTGETAGFNFKILPPFYLTWWAYLFYALLLAVGFFALWRVQLRRLQLQHSRELRQVEFHKLKELDQLKSRFFADISHEFRTPLTLILGPTDHLLAEKPDPEHAKQYNMIKRNAQRLLRLINQLLDLSKLEAGKMKLETQYGDILPLLKGIIHPFESLVQNKNIELSFNTDVKNAYLDFDRDKIEKILYNLISNAVKFTPAGGKIMIEVRKNESEKLLQIDVNDTGAGIAKDQLTHVFDRFYQGSEAARSGETGSGIGLALVKELVELHQGHIKVNSIEGQGTTFSILLPIGTKRPTTEEIFPAKNDDQIFFPEEITPDSVVTMIEEVELTAENTLLLVEDNPDMRAFIRDTLVGSYHIIEAVDGQDGVEKAYKYIPDIIISDVMMPRKDGLQLCEELKHDERTSHIPIILLTAKADIESRLAGLERGADDYLAKPFNRDELLIRSRNLLDLRKRLWERYSTLHPTVPAESKDVQIEDAFLQKIRAIIEDQLSDTELEIEQLSRLVGMSRSQMFRKIKALTGQSPSLYIRSIRLHRAKELLQTTEMNVSEVAYTVGFSTPTYFSDAYLEAYGIRPSQVKK